jgi:hypothetical protein
MQGNVDRYNRLVRRLLGLRGDEIADIGLYLGLELDRPEWAFLRQEMREGLNADAGPIAAQLSYAGFGVPLGTNRLLSTEKIVTQASGTGVEIYTALISDLTAPVQNLVISPKDTRWRPPGAVDNASGVVRITGTQVALPATARGPIERVGGATARNDAVLAVTVDPGFCVLAFGTTVNQLIQTTWQWYSRALEEDEGVGRK